MSIPHQIERTEYKGFIINEEMGAGHVLFTFYSDADPEICGWGQTLGEAKSMIEDIFNEEKLAICRKIV